MWSLLNSLGPYRSKLVWKRYPRHCREVWSFSHSFGLHKLAYLCASMCRYDWQLCGSQDYLIRWRVSRCLVEHLEYCRGEYSHEKEEWKEREEEGRRVAALMVGYVAFRVGLCWVLSGNSCRFPYTAGNRRQRDPLQLKGVSLGGDFDLSTQTLLSNFFSVLICIFFSTHIFAKHWLLYRVVLIKIESGLQQWNVCGFCPSQLMIEIMDTTS